LLAGRAAGHRGDLHRSAYGHFQLVASDLSDRTDSELHVVHVAYLLPMSSEASYMASRLYREAYEELKQEAQELLDEQVEKIKGAGGKVRQEFTSIQACITRK
jgi:hypothetical protein